MYGIGFTAEAHSDIKALPKNVRNSLRKEIEKLAADPVGPSLNLRDPLQGWRSYHWRGYRIIFAVLEDRETVVIAAVGKRLPQSQADVYRRLEGLAKEGKLAEAILRAMNIGSPDLSRSNPPRCVRS